MLMLHLAGTMLRDNAFVGGESFAAPGRCEQRSSRSADTPQPASLTNL